MSTPDFQVLFESAPGLYLVLTPDFDIVAVTDAYLKATLTQREQIIGRGIFEIFPDNPDDPAAAGVRNLRASLERVKAKRSSDAMPVQRYDVRRPDAEGGGFEQRFWSPFNSAVQDEKGELRYIIHRVEDVTEFMRLKQSGSEQRQVTQELQREAERMETEVYQRTREVAEASRKLKEANAELGELYAKTRELDQLKTEFFANVSHELRTPLALILGPTQRLCDAPDVPDRVRAELELVLRNARVLLSRVDDLLDIAKLEAGKMSLEPALVDVAELVRLWAAHFETVARDNDITYVIRAEGELGALVDPERLQGVVLNLLSNAFKFTPRGGTIRCSLIQEARGDAPELCIEVADSGPGIPAEHRGAVFERFRQLEGGSTRRVGGTGLGLAIARELAELHGGNISVDAAPEGGASFKVRLPWRAGSPGEQPSRLAAAAAASASAGVGRASELRPHRRAPAARSVPTHAPLVLVVEDNPEMSWFISDTLSHDYRVETAADGQSGLALALTLQPSVIVSDVMMPGLSGEELVSAVRAAPELATTQILLLTAKTDQAFRVRMLREGAQDLLLKPFGVEELLARVSNLVTSRRAAELAASNAALADRFRIANVELQDAYRELQATQGQLVQTAKMASLGELVAGIAHEINNPLAFAQSHLETARRNLTLVATEATPALTASGLERWERANNRLEEMWRGLERIRELVLKLRTFSRLDEGERKKVSLRECIESVLVLLEHRLKDRVSVELRIEEPDVLECYPGLLNQALMNLIANAIDAITGPGAIQLLGVLAGEEYIIEVCDSGSGIPPALRDRVLEPFFTTRPVGQGTGLGLSITHSIVKKHGGRLTIGEAEGGGARVTLALPRRLRAG